MLFTEMPFFRLFYDFSTKIAYFETQFAYFETRNSVFALFGHVTNSKHREVIALWCTIC